MLPLLRDAVPLVQGTAVGVNYPVKINPLSGDGKNEIAATMEAESTTPRPVESRGLGLYIFSRSSVIRRLTRSTYSGRVIRTGPMPATKSAPETYAR